MENVCISIENLYRTDLFPHDYYYIEVTPDEQGEPYYYDLWVHGELVCMDGEECIILSKQDGKVSLLNTNGERDCQFELTDDEFSIATEI